MLADHEKYILSKPAEWIDEVFKGAVVGTKAMPELSEQFKAQFRDNIGATSSDASWQPKGYFDTVEELQATVTAPKPGDAYGVGLEPPYDIWVWDGLRGRWLNNGPIKGMDGKNGVDGEDGSDANVTKANIIAALGYTPADAENVSVPDGSIGTRQLADGAVTKEKLAPNLDLNSLTTKKLWRNAGGASSFEAQFLGLARNGYQYLAVIGAAVGNDRSTPITVVENTVGKQGDLLGFATNYNYMVGRTFTITETGIDFDDAYYGSAFASASSSKVKSNYNNVPLEIWGIKGVS